MNGREESTPPGVFEELEHIPLALGGERVNRLPIDEDLAAALVQRGHLFTQPIKQRRGRRSRCHANAAGIWASDTQEYCLVTGYALIGGVWWLHSWVVDATRLYETTNPAEQYYGMERTDQEALALWISEYLPEYCPGVASLLKSLADEPGSSSTTSG